jgi:hypothetical protein
MPTFDLNKEDYLLVTNMAEKSATTGTIVEINGKPKKFIKHLEFCNYLCPEVDFTFKWGVVDPEERKVVNDAYDKMAKMFFEKRYPEGFKGFTINIELKKDIYQMGFAQVFSALIVKNQVKESIEKNKLTGVRFVPVWRGNYRPSDKPDYWAMIGENLLNSDYVLDWDIPYTAGKPDGYYPDTFRQHTYSSSIRNESQFDFYVQPYHPATYGAFAPTWVSQKAYQVLKDFTGLKYEPVNFEDRGIY